MTPEMTAATEATEAKKTAKAKAKAKAAKGKPAAKAKADKGPSLRVRVFTALKKAGDKGLTMPMLREKLELARPVALVKHEALAGKNARIAYREEEGTRAVFYVLTAAGRKALDNDTVDSEKPASSVGKSKLIERE